MIWYKAYLETRGRFLLMFALAIICVLPTSPDVHELFGGSKFRPTQESIMRMFSHMDSLPPMIFGVFAASLAGAGINTQTTASTRQGVHGSMTYTLSMPISRRKLVLTRVLVGLGATVAITAVLGVLLWLILPSARPFVSVATLMGYLVSAFVGSTVLYSVSVLLATYFDEMWQFYLATGTCVAAGIMLDRLPAAWNIMRVMSDRSIPAIGGIWWPGWIGCLALSTLLVYVAIIVVEKKEY